MTRHPTLLLVQSPFSPKGVGASLEKRGAHVQRARVGEVREVLAKGCTDLVVLGLSPRAQQDDPCLTSVRGAMKEASARVPLVALADWPLDRPPSGACHVDAVVPSDLPEAAIAHRLLGLAERSAAGRVLEKPLADRIRPLSQSPPAREMRLGEIQLRQQRFPRQAFGSAAGGPESSAKSTSSASPSAPGPAMTPALGSRIPAGLGAAQPGEPQKSRGPNANKIEPTKTVVAGLKGGFLGIHDQPTSPISLPVPEPPDDVDVARHLPPLAADPEEGPADRGMRGSTPPPTTAEARELDRLRESWADGDPQNQLGKWLSQARESIPASDAHPPLGHTPDTVRPPAQSERAARGATPSTGSSSIRVPLTSPARPLSGVRAVLIDEDLTRADALSQTLRAHRVEVYLSSPRLEFFHARLLRKFTPHVVIIDETSIGGVASEFLQRLRRDPFLQHTQLLVVRLDRMFRPRSGATQVDVLLPMLQPLARTELALLEKLGPTCEVEFGLDEVPPHLLLKLLVPRRVSTQIECTRDDECLRWTVGWDCASGAELQKGRQSRSLSHEEAFDWLLSHRNCSVVVIHRPEKEELQGDPILDLIERRLSEDDEEDLDRPRPRMEMRPRLESLVDMGRDEDTAITAYPLSSTRPVTVPRGQRSLRPPAERGKWGWAVAGLVAAGALAAFVVQDRSAESAPAVSAAEIASFESSVPEVDADDEPQGAAENEQTEVVPPAPEDFRRDPFFFVPPHEGVPGCEETLVDFRPPPDQPQESALVYFRQAQSALMVGNSKDAFRKLCQSAQMMPGGPGSIELVRFFLNQRAYDQAEAQLSLAMSHDPDNVEVQMLQGDLASQLGDGEGARKAWLSALKVEESSAAVAVSVGRKYFRDAQLAARQMDWGRTERYLRRSLTLAPDAAAAATLFSEVFDHQGETEMAGRWRERAAELRPQAALQTQPAPSDREEARSGDTPTLKSEARQGAQSFEKRDSPAQGFGERGSGEQGFGEQGPKAHQAQARSDAE